MEQIKKLFKRIFAKSEEELLRDKVLKERVDFDNVVASSLLAKEVYDELKKVCHPDRFQCEQDIKKANELFQLISESKGDYSGLLKLKEQVYQDLPIYKK